MSEQSVSVTQEVKSEDTVQDIERDYPTPDLEEVADEPRRWDSLPFRKRIAHDPKMARFMLNPADETEEEPMEIESEEEPMEIYYDSDASVGSNDPIVLEVSDTESVDSNDSLLRDHLEEWETMLFDRAIKEVEDRYIMDSIFEVRAKLFLLGKDAVQKISHSLGRYYRYSWQAEKVYIATSTSMISFEECEWVNALLKYLPEEGDIGDFIRTEIRAHNYDRAFMICVREIDAFARIRILGHDSP